MAARFDRYIASPESLALPQNYDEFLTGDELHCLIEGCGWSGLQLSSHMNMAHGIPKDKFKEMAGFNVTTGVVTADYSERMSQAKLAQGWGADHMARLRALVKNRVNPPSGPPRLEGKEHHRKARALMEIPPTPFTCAGCGKECVERKWIQKYCSVDCRDKHYVQLNTKKQFTVRCEVCKNEFPGDKNQKRRAGRGQVVVCSFTCRQRRAGHIARGTWEGK